MRSRFDTTPSRSLRAIFWLRTVSLAGQAACLGFALHYAVQLPYSALAAILALLTLLNLATAWRLRQEWPVTELELTAQLAADVLLLTVFLYFTGGPFNPFVSLYLVPLAVGAAVLAARFAWMLALSCAMAYTLLMLRHEPLPHVHGDAFDLHVTGMWLNFLLSAALIAGFVTALARGLRTREQELARAREEALRNERIVALGALAAGAAHELSTPLGTMLITVGELERLPEAAPLRDDLQLLREQIGLCKQRLGELLRSQGFARAEPQPVEQWLTQTARDWQRLRPEVELRISCDAKLKAVPIQPNPALAQTLSSLLNNAADANAHTGHREIVLSATVEGDLLQVRIEDQGPGLSPGAEQRAGRVLFTTKAEGFGLGLVLSDTTLTGLGGELSLHPRHAGGVCAEMRVPLRLRTPANPS